MLREPIPKIPGPVNSIDSIRLDLRSWVEVEDYLKSCNGIILPIGSTEQHGPTGAIGTDSLTAEAVAREVGRLTGVLVAPTQSYGMAEHHLSFPGTMSLNPETLLNLIHDLVLSLVQNGFERIYLINGHGGNNATVKAAFHKIYSSAFIRNIKFSSKIRCRIANWFHAPDVFKQSHKLYGDKEGQHATPSEIAITLHLEPSLLEKHKPLPDPAPPGPIYNKEDFRLRHPDGRMGSHPFLANPNHGKILLDQAAQALVTDLTNFLSEL